MQIESVRSFNRTVTERIGALQDSYLASNRPLGADRVLWEIGDGTDLRTLRTRLGLDSGYLSRLIASLQREGLVETAPGEDKRVRAVTLTEAGRAERASLDRWSDELAQALLAPLSAAQRDRLVEAMATVERLLTAGLVQIAAEDPASADARRCLAAYYEELDARFDGGFEAAKTLPSDDALFLVARLRGEPVGCGAIKTATGDIKRMWVSPAARGLGLGRRMLSELERYSETGTARLETNRSLTEAIGLYRAAGYEEVAPFNDEPYAHHWFGKRL
ncbi:bifunctional helix-turn-helix transcriptional regulator/GNAT family N-acetyltransferase [Solirubrobacter ginsenosidimutans]|uniref:Bifunctional helix-turn-helix transcriptional regulator/GNAT family N-acetyltransferase n=1 Tax=Solirubrobacter ginsenosidimutans TaxID=490573 RepID=A0A9X3MVU6_9ACTN|nr:bifunctional helix-turn-helix transcriptional regulator/GNAT family N-acetyltransferase [Solirubrobacter ginsenosidimutans]MDA0163654.1 bifunctional helix-turn-helix transcriptional regulator/GNAT family N-acetyltransferase [Solirubrobacter ginsenosidimutans]